MDDLIGGEVGTSEVQAASEREDQPYVGLALRWRPRTFDEIVGQRQVAETLRNAIVRGRIAQAYLFCGPRGVGKTSTARILARAINCVKGPTPEPCGRCAFCRAIAAGSDMDVVEIDGASNNKVDDVRELREQVNFTPFAARYKVYIIDEVHMLSTGAFNALLKTLEEPPERVKFIFATTEPHKVPATIKSRCQVCTFSQISEADMVARLGKIIASEPAIEVVADEREAVLQTIARHAEGAMRDALVALDQVVALGQGRVALADVQALLGLVDSDACVEMLEWIVRRETAELLRTVDRLVNGGRDLERVVRQLVGLVRDALILRAGGPVDLIKRTESERKRLAAIIEEVSLAQMVNISQVLIALEEQMRGGMPVRFAVELALVKLTALAGASALGDLIKRIDAMSQPPEDSGCGGGGHGASAADAPRATAAAPPPRTTARPAAARPSPTAAASTPVPLVQERHAAALDAPRTVPAAALFPEDLPAASTAAATSADPRVSEPAADFEIDASEEALPAADLEPGAAARETPRAATPGDPRAWLRETLDRDPSLAQTMAAIKEIFSAREIALDGIPLS